MTYTALFPEKSDPDSEPPPEPSSHDPEAASDAEAACDAEAFPDFDEDSGAAIEPATDVEIRTEAAPEIDPANSPETGPANTPETDTEIPVRGGGKHRCGSESRSSGSAAVGIGRAMRSGKHHQHRGGRRLLFVSGGVVLAGAAVGATVLAGLPPTQLLSDARVSEAVRKEPVRPANPMLAPLDALQARADSAGPAAKPQPPIGQAADARSSNGQSPKTQSSNDRSGSSAGQQSTAQAQPQQAQPQQAQPHQAQPAQAAAATPDPVSQKIDDLVPADDQVGTWINQAVHELVAQGYSLDDIDPDAIRTIIKHESGGNPRATNNSDSNAAKGTPSKGLMQTIAPTFRVWALPGHGDIYDPVDNIIAGVRYSMSTYGSLSKVPGISGLHSGGSYRGY